MISKENIWSKRLLVVLTIVILIITCVLVVLNLHTSKKPDYITGGGDPVAPDKGTWICEELGLTLYYYDGYEYRDSIWNNNGTIIPCSLSYNRFSPYVSLFEIDAKIPLDESDGFDHTVYAYKEGEMLFTFKVLSFTDDSMIVSDDTGNVYTFYRDDTLRG